MKTKILLLTILLVSKCIISQELNRNCFGISIGAGPSYVACGFSLNYDWKHFGTSLLLSPYDFPFNSGCKLRLNTYLATGSVIIGPEISLGHYGKTPPFYPTFYSNFNYFGLEINLTGYISKHFYIKNNYGIDNFELPKYGLGLGYTFKGGNYCELWKKENFIINGIVFGTGSILPVLIHFVFYIWSND